MWSPRSGYSHFALQLHRAALEGGQRAGGLLAELVEIDATVVELRRPLGDVARATPLVGHVVQRRVGHALDRPVHGRQLEVERPVVAVEAPLDGLARDGVEEHLDDRLGRHRHVVEAHRGRVDGVAVDVEVVGLQVEGEVHEVHALPDHRDPVGVLPAGVEVAGRRRHA